MTESIRHNLTSVSYNANCVHLNSALLESLAYLIGVNNRNVYKVNKVYVPESELQSSLPEIITVDYIDGNKIKNMQLFLHIRGEIPFYSSTVNGLSNYLKIYCSSSNGVSESPDTFNLAMNVYMITQSSLIDSRFQSMQFIEKHGAFMYTSTLSFAYDSGVKNGHEYQLDPYSLEMMIKLDATKETVEYGYDIVSKTTPTRRSKLIIRSCRNYDTGRLEQNAILFA